MATVTGSKYNNLAPYFDYTASNTDPASYLLDLSSGYTWTTLPKDIGGGFRIKLSVTGDSSVYSSRVRWSDLGGIITSDHKYPEIFVHDYISKTHSTQSVTVTATLQTAPASSTDYTNRTTATKTFSIPAKTSYSVTYNANGGSGAPASQTKWFGEKLTLSSTIPTKSGYTFKGWATSKENANNGSVTYAAGATYSLNVKLTLYAVWELTYSKPKITNFVVKRCSPDPDNVGEYIPDDEGEYALVTFNWSVFVSDAARYYGADATDSNNTPYKNNGVSSCVITVDGQTPSTAPSLTDPSDPVSVVIGNGSFLVDTSYPASVTITDSQSVYTTSGANSTTVSGTLTKANFPMDFNEDGTAVGFFMPAPSSGEGSGMYVGGNITAENHSTPIGRIESAAWITNSTTASGVALTGTITLTPGTYIIVVSLPETSRSQSYYLMNISSPQKKYWNVPSMGTFTVICNFTTTTQTAVMSAASASTTYDVTNGRGHIEAVRIV